MFSNRVGTVLCRNMMTNLPNSCPFLEVKGQQITDWSTPEKRKKKESETCTFWVKYMVGS